MTRRDVSVFLPGGDRRGVRVSKRDQGKPARAQTIPIVRPGRDAILNELGAIAGRLKALKPLQDRYEQLRKQVLSWHEDEAPDKAITLETDQYVVEVGARGNERHIRSIRHLQKRMGPEFWKYATVPMSALDNILTAQEAPEFIDRLQTGPRRVTVTPKFAEEPLQAAA